MPSDAKPLPDPSTAEPTGDLRAEVRAACAGLCQPGQMRRQHDLLTRARLIQATLGMRERVLALQQRTDALRAALERFEARRAELGR